jgi:hypothetical protein
MKNTNGSLGPICNNCGGFGFTNNIEGGATGCAKCEQTGIQPPDIRELATKVNQLTDMVAQLTNLMTTSLNGDIR